jgi:antitoxin YefM
LEAVTYSTFRNNLRHYLDKTRDDAERIMVTSKDPSANVVVLNAEDYENLMENLQIMSNPYLMDKIQKSREQFAQGEVVVRDLIEDEDD